MLALILKDGLAEQAIFQFTNTQVNKPGTPLILVNSGSHQSCYSKRLGIEGYQQISFSRSPCHNAFHRIDYNYYR